MLYDANGAFTREKRNGQDYREVTWAAHQNVKEFKLTGGPRVLKVDGTELYAAGNTTTTFDYDAGYSRSKKVTERDRLQREVTSYLGSYERIVYESRANPNVSYTLQKIEHRHSIGGLALKTFTQQAGVTSEETVYYLKDHLGSLTATVDAAGVVKERYSFDAWGSRRDAATWSDSTYDPLTKTTATNRGYTGHEMLDELGIVHMNGRLYDPEIGRVLSGDPIIQEPDNAQNYNRYSYVINNPLSLTDPSGFSFWKSVKKVFKSVFKATIFGVVSLFKDKITKWLAKNEWAMVVVSIVVGIVSAGIGTAMALAITGAQTAAQLTLGGMMIAGAIGGAIAGGANAALAGGDLGDVLKGAAVGAFQGAASGALHFTEGLTNIVGHGLVGGVTNELMGGKFQDGFLSAAAGAALNGVLDGSGLYGKDQLLGYPGDNNITLTAVRTTIAGIAGGTAAAVGGGKFANGFYTAAMQHLFNAESLDEMARMVRRNNNMWSPEYREKQLRYYLELGLKGTNQAIDDLKYSLFILDPASQWYPKGSAEYERFVSNQYQSLEVARLASFTLGDRPSEYHAAVTIGAAAGGAFQVGLAVDIHGIHTFRGWGSGWIGPIASLGVGKGAVPPRGSAVWSAGGGFGLGGSIDQYGGTEIQATTPWWSVMRNKY